jgi:hypothetical protein
VGDLAKARVPAYWQEQNNRFFSLRVDRTEAVATAKPFLLPLTFLLAIVILSHRTPYLVLASGEDARNKRL